MKKLVTGVLLFVTLLSISGLNVQAEQSREDYREVRQMVRATNREIRHLIREAKHEARFIMRDRSLTEEAKTEALEALGAELILVTDEIANETIAQAALLGYNVVCEYKAVKLGNIEVLVDPLRVGGWGKTPPVEEDTAG